MGGQTAGVKPAHIHWPSPASNKKKHGSSFRGTQSRYQDEKCNLQLKQFRALDYRVGKQMHLRFYGSIWYIKNQRRFHGKNQNSDFLTFFWGFRVSKSFSSAFWNGPTVKRQFKGKQQQYWAGGSGTAGGGTVQVETLLEAGVAFGSGREQECLGEEEGNALG